MNNIKVLKKALEELGKEEPKLDYIRGMLEVLVNTDDIPVSTPTIPFVPAKPKLDSSVNPHGLPSDNVGMDILSGNTIK